jgi:hypothetical protein
MVNVTEVGSPIIQPSNINLWVTIVVLGAIGVITYLVLKLNKNQNFEELEE